MSKLFTSVFLIVFSAGLLADASVDAKTGDKSFLLNAPGTLTGTIKTDSGGALQTNAVSASSGGTLPDQPRAETSAAPRFPPQQRMSPPSSRYRYVEDNVRKFRQFGQTSGQNNPWFDENGRRYAAPAQPMTSQHPITNPWQLGGMPPMTGQTEGHFNSYPYAPYNSGAYPSNNRLYPDYPDGIYRDNNPALLGMPGQSGFLPGFDGNNFPMPFSPFGLF